MGKLNEILKAAEDSEEMSYLLKERQGADDALKQFPAIWDKTCEKASQMWNSHAVWDSKKVPYGKKAERRWNKGFAKQLERLFLEKDPDCNVTITERDYGASFRVHVGWAKKGE